ncbi:MAG: alpha/beta fold hydrolase [Pseudomonadota bacterium]
MIRRFVVALVFSASCIAGNAAAEPDIEAYGALPFVSSTDLSPSGEYFAAIVNTDGRQLLLVSAVSDGTQRLMVDISNHKARGLSFFGEDHVILNSSITTSANRSRFDYEYSAAVAIDLNSTDATQLLYRTTDLHPRQSGLGRMVARNVDTLTAYMPAYVGDTNVPDFDLFSNGLDRSRGVRIARGTRDTIDWFVGPDGQEIAREDFNARSEKYAVISYANGERRTIYEEDGVSRVPISVMGLTEGADALYFIDAASDGEAFETLFKLSFDGEITETDFGKPNAEIDLVFLDDNRVVRGLKYSGFLPSYRFFDAQLQANADQLLAEFPDAMVSILSWSDDQSRILFRVFDGTHVDRYGVWSENGDLSLLASRRRGIAPEDVGRVSAINYAARDGMNIPALITLPADVGADLQDLPAIVLPHGGPASYDRIDFDWLAQYFAAKGYLVFQPNFRGSTGFGGAHRSAGNGEWGRAMQDDITDGVQLLIDEDLIDPKRICIVGASYGGYAALAGGAFTPDLYRCVVSIAGVADVKEMIDQVDRESSSRTGRTKYWQRSISDGDTSRARLESVSPSKHADAFQAPVLLIHGRDDTVVPIRQSEIMNRALRRADKDVELIKLRGEDHWLSTSETRIATLEAIDAFLDEHNPAG